MIYWDYNATTPLAPSVYERTCAVLREVPGNASSLHQAGQKARFVIDESREKIGRFLNCDPGEIYFTSGATEANNWVLQGVMRHHAKVGSAKNHLITSSIEHPSVLEVVQRMGREGMDVDFCPVHPNGQLHIEALRQKIKPTTALISVMHVNNETGVIQPIEDVLKIAREHQIAVHVDAVQAIGKIKTDYSKMGFDYVTVSSHKMYGPKGCGILLAKRGSPLLPLLTGGHQEKNMRPGTENAALIAGFAEACEWVQEQKEILSNNIRGLRNKLYEGLRASVPGMVLNGDLKQMVYNTLNLRFDQLDGTLLMMKLDLKGIAVSTGSACTAGSVAPSPVLLAMGLSEKEAKSSIRISLGAFSTSQEVEEGLKTIPQEISRLRSHVG